MDNFFFTTADQTQKPFFFLIACNTKEMVLRRFKWILEMPFKIDFVSYFCSKATNVAFKVPWRSIGSFEPF